MSSELEQGHHQEQEHDEGHVFGRELAGKYMTFKLGNEEYGLQILKVREIIRLMDITRVPRSPHFVRGVINLRGKVNPVIDLRLKFSMSKTESTEQTVIIVVQFYSGSQEVTMGILVDEVLEVLDIESSQIEPPPTFSGDRDTSDYILGMAKADGRVIFLLNIDHVLNADEVIEVVNITGKSGQ